MPKTVIGNILQNLGWVVGMNLLVLGFFFSGKLGEATGPVFLVLLALFIIVCGLSIKFKPLLIGGVITNFIGLGSFFFDMDYHGFSMMLGAVVGLIIPGILLNNARRKENV
jgi:MFS family permease